MKPKTILFILWIAIFSIGCNNKNAETVKSDYEKVLVEREQKAVEPTIIEDGKLEYTILYEVKADLKDFENGIQPWATIEKPETDLPNLIKKDEIVISENEITILIDYPLTNKYKFDLKSDSGFSRSKLLAEISKHYFLLYEEEEKTATIKTIPMEKRTMYNRNETNGKYGVWGHDIADLVLTEIQVYKTKDGKTVLTLGVDS